MTLHGEGGRWMVFSGGVGGTKPTLWGFHRAVSPPLRVAQVLGGVEGARAISPPGVCGGEEG